ncbi:MAG: BadF/BadG/BcrA/BcrD ATPase family protein [Ignavibacteria bacterium]
MSKRSDGFYAGIDSGGTKCEVLIASENITGSISGKILFKRSYKGVHYSVAGLKLYSEKVSGFIKNSIASAKLDLKNCRGICLGVAGAREDNDRKKLKSSFQRILGFKDVLVTTDAMTALYGAFEGDEGIILISGTGSVLYGFSKGKLTRIGGWGRIIGDEGSGYWIGKRALNLLMKEYEKGDGGKSMLAKKVYNKFGIDHRNVVEKVFNENFEIQLLAPLVIECAEKKCGLSLKIVNEAVDGLIQDIKTFIKVSKRKRSINIAFIGSIIENRNILSDKLKREINKLKIVKVVPKKHSSSYGAVLLASENSPIINKL